MGEYDAVWVFLISLVFVGFYIFIEAKPKGSNLFGLCVLYQWFALLDERGYFDLEASAW